MYMECYCNLLRSLYSNGVATCYIVMSRSPSSFNWDGTTVNKRRKYTGNDEIVVVANVPLEVEHVVVADSVTEIPAHAFIQHDRLRSIYIPVSVSTIGELAFRRCSSLQSIVIPSSVTTIGNRAFWGCSSLQSIGLPASVTTIGDEAFRGCSSLQCYVILTAVLNVGPRAFEGCRSMQYLRWFEQTE